MPVPDAIAIEAVPVARPRIVEDPTVPPGEIVAVLDPPQPDTPETRARVANAINQTVQHAVATGAVADFVTNTFSGTQTLVWRNWNTSATTSALDYTYTGDSSIWTSWVSDQTITLHYSNAHTNATGTATWAGWVTNQDARTAARMRVHAYDMVQTRQGMRQQPAPETPEQRVERLAQEELRRQQYALEAAVARERRAAAIGRADKLLESVLSSVQRSQLEKNDWFLVRGESGQVYRIRKGRAANVDLIDPKTGKVIDVLCAYPRMDVPDGDCMVAQKLMLECDEEAFRKIAIRHSPRGEVPLAAVRALLH